MTDMTIDLKQFHQTYYEECSENLQIMESGMLNLSEGDLEQINVIFRAAHSIKGGSGTFGFDDIAAFTHKLETLLDELRKGWRPVDKDVIGLLLESVDCLREMIRASQNGTALNEERVLSLSNRYEQLSGSGAPPAEVQNSCDETGASGGWFIRFKPKPHLFQTGNDPALIFRALQDLGGLEVKTDTSSIPPFSEMDPELCSLRWELTLRGNVGREQIAELFEWVEGDCELDISPLVEIRDGGVPSSPASRTPMAAPGQQERRSGADRRQDASIRVSTDKIDALINTVGELVITQAMLSQLGENFDIKKLDKLRDGLDQLERNTHELQESVMRIRMLPISFAFSRFPRLVHDLSQKLGKKVDLEMVGEQTELDKTVMEKIGDPLVHLVRNSLDHGIETPEERVAVGKPETGVIRLSAYHKGGNICIEISDDGKGINRERLLRKGREAGAVGPEEELSDERILDLIFLPGVSTAEEVSDLSGRGVGMDVVRRNIRELQGQIEVHSREGQGTTVLIRLPLTLAILEGQLVRIGAESCIIPLVSIVESLQLESRNISVVGGRGEIYTLRGAHIPVIRLADVFGFGQASDESSGSLMVVVESDGERVGVVVDELLGQQQVVIKSLETNFKPVEGISGATILGDGAVALIIDIGGLIAVSRRAA